MYRILLTAALAIAWAATARAGPLLLQAPDGLRPGAQFQIVFVTDGVTRAGSSSISTYNSFVTNDADTEAHGQVYFNGQLVTFSAIGSTSTVSATTNIGIHSAAVYLADGTRIAISTTSSSGGLWSGTLLNPINEDLTGNVPIPISLVWTGTLPNGQIDALHALGSAQPQLGDPYNTDSTWVDYSNGATGSTNSAPMYGISDVLTVPSAVPEPASMLLALTGLGSAFGWRLTRRR